MWIFIRHDIKEYSNGKGIPRFDPPLAKLRLVIHDEILENFDPDKIICSPFKRCRETSRRYYPDIDPIIDTTLSEFLGHWENINESDFDPETWQYIKDLEIYRSFKESLEDLKIRLGSFARSFEKSSSFIEHENILVITHGLCLEILGDFFRKAGFKCKRVSSDPKFGFQIDIKTK